MARRLPPSLSTLPLSVCPWRAFYPSPVRISMARRLPVFSIVAINFSPLSNILPLIEDRKARPLAFTGNRRTPHLPDVPTMLESGYPQVGFNPDSWLSFLGPVGMPAAIVEQLNAEINQSLRSPELSAALGKLGIEPQIGSPKEFASFLASEMQKWPPLLRAAGLKPA